MKEITVTTSIDQVRPVTGFVNSYLEELCCSEDARVQIDIAIDELFGNIIRYAYHPDTGPVTICIDSDPSTDPNVNMNSKSKINDDPGIKDDQKDKGPGVYISFIDRGVPFDPLQTEDPDLSEPLRTRPIGGLGIYVVKNIMDDISYRYEDGQNILTVFKRL